MRNIIRTIQEDMINTWRVRHRRKIFCVGRNKTGTTSIKEAFERLGFVVGNQHRAERLIDDYINGDFRSLIRYSRTAQVFQDFPFSYPETFKVVDKAFPGSKFILTVRDTPEQWYTSITRFHSKLFGQGSLPDERQLREATYVYPGWMWKAMRYHNQVPSNAVYDKEALMNGYTGHNEEVLNHFKGRPDDLLVLNLARPGAYQDFCNFVGIKSTVLTAFPWENKTESIKTRL